MNITDKIEKYINENNNEYNFSVFEKEHEGNWEKLTNDIDYKLKVLMVNGWAIYFRRNNEILKFTMMNKFEQKQVLFKCNDFTKTYTVKQFDFTEVKGRGTIIYPQNFKKMLITLITNKNVIKETKQYVKNFYDN